MIHFKKLAKAAEFGRELGLNCFVITPNYFQEPRHYLYIIRPDKLVPAVYGWNGTAYIEGGKKDLEKRAEEENKNPNHPKGGVFLMCSKGNLPLARRKLCFLAFPIPPR